MCTEALTAYAARLDEGNASPEMLAIASARLPQEHIHFIESDIFGWQPVRAPTTSFSSRHGVPPGAADYWFAPAEPESCSSRPTASAALLLL